MQSAELQYISKEHQCFVFRLAEGKLCNFETTNSLTICIWTMIFCIKSPVSKVLPSTSKSTHDQLVLMQQCNCQGQQNVPLMAIWPYLSKELPIEDMTFECKFSSSAAVAAAFLSMFSKQHRSFSDNMRSQKWHNVTQIKYPVFKVPESTKWTLKQDSQLPYKKVKPMIKPTLSMFLSSCNFLVSPIRCQ